MSSERQDLDRDNPWWGEHVHRYDYTITHFANKEDKVLDIACGTGFGTDLLAEYSNNEIIGGDISEEAIQFCTENISRENLKFQTMDGTKLPFEDGHFDLITSFETIEHTTAFQKMIEEFKRVTKQGGTIVISTPNFIINSPSGVVTNPFHTQEWIYEDFIQLLSENFSDFKVYGQKYARYSKTNLASSMENLLLKRGVRKMPISLQNGIMKMLGQQGVYPATTDFEMVESKEEILKCKTFYAVCKK